MFDVIFKMGNSYYQGNINNHFVTFTPYGGGYIRKMAVIDFSKNCEVVEGIPDALVDTWVNIDFAMPIKAYANPHNRWNGWAVPCFDIGQVDQVAKYYGDQTKIERIEGGFKLIDLVNDFDEEISEDFEIVVNGETKVVNSFMSGWCWELIDMKQAIAFLFIYEVAKYLDEDERQAIDSANEELPEGRDAISDHPKIGDVNMVFFEAFKKVVGESQIVGDSPDEIKDAETDLWNAAWEQAKFYGYASAYHYD